VRLQHTITSSWCKFGAGDHGRPRAVPTAAGPDTGLSGLRKRTLYQRQQAVQRVVKIKGRQAPDAAADGQARMRVQAQGPPL